MVPKLHREEDTLSISREIRSRWDPLIYQVVVILSLLHLSEGYWGQK